jgi:hypothetical protein
MCYCGTEGYRMSEKPEPGDAISVSPTADANGTTVGTADAGRLLHYAPDAHGATMAHYHSLSSNRLASTPEAAIARLEEGDDADESRHPSLTIVPLRIGDTKHEGRSVIFHNGLAQGTVDPGKVAGQPITTVSSTAMGPDKHFLEREKAIDAIHDHFAPEHIEKEKFATLADILKADEPKHDPKTGQFVGGGWKTGSYKDVTSLVPISELLSMRGNKLGKTDLEDLKSSIKKNGIKEPAIIEFDHKKNLVKLVRGYRSSLDKDDMGAVSHDLSHLVKTDADGFSRHVNADMSPVDLKIKGAIAPPEPEKEKAMTVSDILKTEHDAKTGQFTSGSGKTYSVGEKKTARDGGTVESRQAVHDGDKHIGTINHHGGNLHSVALPPKRDVLGTHHAFVPAKPHGKKNDRYFASHERALHGLTHYHEHGKVGDFSSAAGAKRTLTSVKSAKEKSMTIGDIFKDDSHPRSIADLFKGDGVVSPAPGGNYSGSFEDTLKRIRGPVCMGSGCSDKPEYDDAGNRVYESGSERMPHYLDVIATFPDYAIVRCSDEDKTWKVPYDFDGNAVSTGEPEAVVAQFVPASEAGEDTTDLEGDDEVDDE